MKATLYPNIAYFRLAKPMPLCPIGSTVFIRDADGRQHLRCNDIELPFDTAINEPDWFTPVSISEYEEEFKEASIQYVIERGKTREQAIRFLGYD